MKQLKVTQRITNRQGQSLEKYFNEISKVELITTKEEIDLACRIREVDSVALEKLVKSNLRFVVSVAKQYKSNYLTLEDLISEGNLGLIRAAKKFDETRGFKFISYAVWWIRQSIMMALAVQGRTVRLPLNRISSIRKISKTASELEQTLEREPTIDELAETLDLLPDDIRDNMVLSSSQLSMDAPFGSEGDGNLMDTIINKESENPDSKLIKESLTKDINQVLESLTKRESLVISMFYGLDGKSKMSLNDIASKFNLTRERIRQIKETATHKIRQNNRSKILQTYLC